MPFFAAQLKLHAKSSIKRIEKSAQASSALHSGLPNKELKFTKIMDG